MEILLFLWPSSIVGKMIVTLLIAIFAGWCWYLYKWATTLKSQYIPEVDAFCDISELAQVIHSKTVEKNVTSNKNTVRQLKKAASNNATEKYESNETTLEYLKSKMYATFGEFCTSKTINDKPIDPNSPIVDHVRLLYQTGMLESRIDVAELLKNTTSKIFHANYVIKNILATFIVIGLLGTLLGLADSLNNLPISLKMSETINLANGHELNQSNSILKQAIDKLFEHLHSAFAPSIWGTAFTVLGIGFYMYTIHTVCKPLRYKLEYYTNSIWVPQLIPTTSQKALESLHLLEMNMGKNIEAAQKVAEFAQNIEQEVDGFGITLKKANKTLKTISEYGDKMHMVATTFGDSISHVGSYQKDVQDLYQKFIQSTDMYQTTFNESRGQIASLVDFSKQTFIQHGEHIEQMLTVLQQYETNYMQDKKENSELSRYMLKETKQNLELLEQRNKEIIEAVGRPIAQNLADGLKQIEDTSNLHLSALVSKFERFDAPLADTARLMSETFEAVVKRMEGTLQSILREATRQNESSVESTKHINELSKRIHDLLVKMEEPKERAEQNIANLERNIQSLGESIKQLNLSTGESSAASFKSIKEEKQSMWKKVSLGVATVLIMAIVGGLGYSQYKVMTTLQEVQKINSQIIIDIKKQENPQNVLTVVAPSNTSSQLPQATTPSIIQ